MGRGVVVRVVTFTGPRVVALTEEEDQALAEDAVRVQTLYSGISAGTELTGYRGSNPYLNKRWDADRRLFVEGQSSLSYPLQGWGYEEVGRVIEVGASVQELRKGDVVWGMWGHRASAVIDGERAAACLLPTDLAPVIGVFPHIGAIALNAVLEADIHVGETVAVFGQGVPGLIAAQLARLNGGEVVAIDGVPKRLELASQLGAAHVVDFTQESPAERLKELTEGRGADVSIEISGSYYALNEAIRATASSSRVIAAGFYQGEAAGLFLGDEFHHNRVQVICAQIDGVSARLSHRWNLIRLEHAVMQMALDGRLRLEELVSHLLPPERVAEAFALLDGPPADTLQIVLDFQGE